MLRPRASRKTIVQVAFEVGYESEAAFNRAFKREFGLPPAQYRRTIANDNTDVVGRTRTGTNKSRQRS